MKDFIEYVAKGLVDKPELVEVSSRQDGDCTVYDVIVDKSDLGKVVGKNGKIANSLRVLTRSIARGKHIVIKIKDQK